MWTRTVATTGEIRRQRGRCSTHTGDALGDASSAFGPRGAVKRGDDLEGAPPRLSGMAVAATAVRPGR